MKRIISALLLTLMLFASFSFAGCEKNTLATTNLPHYDYFDRQTSDYNSELFYQNDLDIALGDPAVLFVDGWYYVTGTKSGKDFKMWRTKNFTNWDEVGTIYTPPSDFFGENSFWAPQLMYDPEADWQYYLGNDAGSGKGLYILAFSARDKNGLCSLAISFSKNVDGPYLHFKGTNANGDAIDPSRSVFEMSKLKGLDLYKDHPYGDLYKENRSFIDACPYIDPVTGEKYLYMVRSRNVDASNDVWGVKMKDWVSPEYSTTTPLSSYGYTTVEMTEKHNFSTENKIDEGPFVYYKDNTDDNIDNGKYYLTLSIGDTDDKLYPVCQAIGDSPLGPFTKIQPQDGGLLSCPEMHWDIHGCGHHAFFEMDGELYIAYHTFEITDPRTIGSRYFACDKVEWTYNENGQYLMYSNGPTNTVQPLPSITSGYKNIAPLANITANADGAELLNDGLIAHNKNSLAKEFSSETDAQITLEFDSYVTARAIMIYNSYDYDLSFDGIEKIEFSYKKEIDGKTFTGTAVINDLGFDLESNRIDPDYVKHMLGEKTPHLRPGSAAIAEFNELEINKITIYITKNATRDALNVSEIVVLGRVK